jgi:16S rRNA (cytosine967-C5)-methyltransferase
VRGVAAQIVAAVMHGGKSLTQAFKTALPQVALTDRSLCQQLAYGTIRHYSALNWLAQQLLKKPLKAKESEVLALLLIGLYQLRSMRTPPHAAISETVNATKNMGKPWATGLLNACLRQYQRQHTELEHLLTQQADVRWAHPSWMIQRYQTDWPEQWQAILEANNQQPPMMLRVNAHQHSREHYLKQLSEQQIEAKAINTVASAVLLSTPCDVGQLPGFFDGAASVQDGAAQKVADLMSIAPDQRILDACAAPGGKTCHLLELCPSNEVWALDISADRLEQVQENLDRLKLKAKLVAADAANTTVWWDGQPFDRILIDAPCSGSGVIRRHPDIKLLRKETDIEELRHIQADILDQLWPLLKQGGRMVYTTCSAFKTENEAQIEAFLQRHPDAKEVRVEKPPANERSHGYQRLPGEDEMDGFFYACLEHA